MLTNNAVHQYNKKGKFIGCWFWKAILLKEAEKTKASQKEKQKSSCHDQSKLWARSSKYCKSDLAPASIGSKVLQPPGAKSCWIKILQKQVNFVPAGFVLLWVSSVPPKAGTEDGGSINTKARDVSNLTEMGAYIHAPAGSVGDLVVSSSTSNKCGTITKKREGTFRLRTAWKKSPKYEQLSFVALFFHQGFDKETPFCQLLCFIGYGLLSKWGTIVHLDYNWIFCLK